MSKNYYNGGSYYGSKCNCCGNDNNMNECDEYLRQYVVGNSVNFDIDDCDSEIKADITVGHRETVRVWGQIRDCDGCPVPYAYLKLIRNTGNGMEGIAHTITDCNGYYQFDICKCTDGTNFSILVGKAARGRERIISTGVNGTACGSTICNIENCNC
ncbi:MAG: hypothetical protein ACRCTZ_19175 [Sarcina sp.]